MVENGLFHNLALLILALPLFSFVFIIFFGYYIKNRASHLLATWLMMVTIVLSAGILWEKISGTSAEKFIASFDWVKVGGLTIPFQIFIDNVSAITLFMVTITAGMIHLFSQGYMKGQVRYSRFFALISLFSFAMLGAVMADHLILFYIFWEIMGFCSYALIGFYFEKRSAQLAMKKAFIVTRVGDVGMLLGIILLYFTTGSVTFSDIASTFAGGSLPVGQTVATAIGILLFCGAVGKSAQFPLHVWLPDAMEGPTPVSALIHAATMVSAGVYFVIRIYPIIVASEVTSGLVAIIGGFTALMTALIGLVQKDIKRVLAYSTMSQLGYMFLALGALGYTAGAFHLINHAYFKAGLFLGSGSVIVALHHEQDMRRMGGLAKFMPITFATFLACALSLMGIPPFSGFWSKDEVLASVFSRATEAGGFWWLLFVFGEVTALITALYMTRLLILSFAGVYRGNDPPPEDYLADKSRLEKQQIEWEIRKYGQSLGGLATLYTEPEPALATVVANGGTPEHQGFSSLRSHSAVHGHFPKESPWVITVSLIVLAIFATFFGFVGAAPLGIGLWQSFIHFGAHHESVNYFVLALSTAMAFSGLLLGYLIWGVKMRFFQVLYKIPAVKALEEVLVHKFYFDEFYDGYIVKGVVALARALSAFDIWVIDLLVNAFGAGAKLFAYAYAWFDLWVIDGLVNVAGYFWLWIKWLIRPIQSGYLQHYIFIILLWALIFFMYRYLF